MEWEWAVAWVRTVGCNVSLHSKLTPLSLCLSVSVSLSVYLSRSPRCVAGVAAGMRGGGMQGMQGQQGMQGMQPMPPPPEDEEPEIREKHVQQALEFVAKPEVSPGEDDDDEEREKKMEQIKQYLDKNMGLEEHEMNAVFKRSGLDPTAGDSTEDSSESEEDEDDEDLDYEAQQNHDMRGSIPAPIALSIAALLLSVPNHKAWWQWVMGTQPPAVGRPLQQQLGGGGPAAAASGVYQAAAATPPIVVINQGQGAGAAAASAGLAAGRSSNAWGARRWIITAIGVWFVITWVRANFGTVFLPQYRNAVATAATAMGLDVKVRPSQGQLYGDSDDEENDEELQGEVADLKLLLADLRGELANTKKAALDKFEAHRQGQLQSSQAENR